MNLEQQLAGRTAAVSLDLTVRWGDLDAFNHVNNTRFLRYLEEARVVWFSNLPDAWGDERYGPVVVNVNVDFRQPITWPETLRVTLYPVHDGGKSLRLLHRITAADEEEKIYSEAVITVVWIDKTANRAVDLPAGVLKSLVS